MTQNIWRAPLFSRARLLGIDYGSKVMGLALFQLDRDPFPMPFDRLVVKNEEQVLGALKQVCSDELIDVIILGVPFMIDGKETELSRQIKLFGRELEKRTGIPVLEQDETLSTFEAQERMKNSPRYQFKVDPKQIDSLCAAIILEDFCRHQGK